MAFSRQQLVADKLQNRAPGDCERTENETNESMMANLGWRTIQTSTRSLFLNNIVNGPGQNASIRTFACRGKDRAGRTKLEDESSGSKQVSYLGRNIRH